MRYIRNISDDQNKSGDTDNIFRFNLLQGEDIFNFGDYPISINIANSSGYILSMVPEKEFGNSVLKLDFNDQSLKSLTPDNYLLEVEVKFPDGTTATFPTKGGMPFTVNSNLKNTAGHLVPTVTFDEVLNAVDEKVNNYLATVVKGDKGDTGVVDTTADYTWTGTNTFNKKIIAQAGVQGNIQGNIQGNAETATKLQTARLVGGVAFDGTSDITLPGVNAKGNQDTSGRAANATNADHANNASSADLSTKTVALQTPRKINGTNFDGTSDINVNASNDGSLVHKTGTETVAGDKTFTGSTDIQNQKRYKASFSIGANTINLTRIGSIVYVNAKTIETINGGNSYGAIPIGFTPANNSVINFIVALNQGSCLFQATKDVWFPVTANYDSNLSGSYLTNDPLPSQ